MSPHTAKQMRVQHTAENWRHWILTRPKSNQQMTDTRQREIEPASTRTMQVLPPSDRQRT